jgi:predicted flap endonuclease-1-like 5' DNA nuclease
MKIILLQQFSIADCWWWWLLASLVSFLLGLLLGYWLWYKYRSLLLEREEELKRLRSQLVDWEEKNKELQYQVDEVNKTMGGLRHSLHLCEADKEILKSKLDQIGGALDPGAPGGLNYGNVFTNDNLQIFEGIGAKIEQVLKAAGITTWAQLAASNTDELVRVLENAGPTFRIHNPSTWSQQAQLAQAGNWEELIRYQKTIGGNNSDGDNASKVEKLAMRKLGFSNNPDDLQIIEGIGAKIEKLLKDAGISNWHELSMTSTERLQEILTAAGATFRLANPGTWAHQARLAHEGKWGELAAYQDFLDGGNEPGV